MASTMAAYQHFGGGTVGGLLRARAAAAPDQVLLMTGSERYTYAEVAAITDYVAKGLLAMGYKQGDRVAILCGNGSRYIFAWLGLVSAGLVHVPVNTAYKADFLTDILQHSEARVLVAEPSMIENMRTASLESVESIIFTSDDVPAEANALSVSTVEGWGELIKIGMDSDVELPTVYPWDTSAIRYTSGTTGRSKGVLTPHLEDVVMADENGAALGITSEDVLYTCLPLFHGAAQMSAVVCAINAGATVALSRRFSASRFWDEIRQYEATSFIVVGSLLFMLLAQAESPDDRNHPARVAFAAPAPQHALYRFEKRFGVTLIEGYGQTETKNIVFNPRNARRPGSVGKPTPTSIVAIVDVLGNELGPGEVGEFVYRPTQPHIMLQGYYKDPQATAEASRDMWWHTGDLGYYDKDGYFYFVDRLKDALRRRGENISSSEVEAVLLAHPSVLDAAVISVTSDVAEDDLMAVLRLQEGAVVDWSEFFEFCDSKLPYFMVPRYFRVVEDMPYTPNGKIRKVELREAGLTHDTWDSFAHGHQPSKLGL
jgi:crotonobetaine/carnitine-CoA ligase